MNLGVLAILVTAVVLVALLSRHGVGCHLRRVASVALILAVAAYVFVSVRTPRRPSGPVRFRNTGPVAIADWRDQRSLVELPDLPQIVVDPFPEGPPGHSQVIDPTAEFLQHPADVHELNRRGPAATVTVNEPERGDEVQQPEGVESPSASSPAPATGSRQRRQTVGRIGSLRLILATAGTLVIAALVLKAIARRSTGRY
jgi:Ca2+/Na+ antiporter